MLGRMLFVAMVAALQYVSPPLRAADPPLANVI